MAKRVALKDYIEVDGVDLSNFARSVDATFEHNRVDASGFNATGADEFLPGSTTHEITIEFFGSYGTGEVHQTLYPIFRDKDVVMLRWRPDQTAVASATNPEAHGMVSIYTWTPGATRGDVEIISVTFLAADEDGIVIENDS